MSLRFATAAEGGGVKMQLFWDKSQALTAELKIGDLPEGKSRTTVQPVQQCPDRVLIDTTTVEGVPSQYKNKGKYSIYKERDEYSISVLYDGSCRMEP